MGSWVFSLVILNSVKLFCNNVCYKMCYTNQIDFTSDLSEPRFPYYSSLRVNPRAFGVHPWDLEYSVFHCGAWSQELRWMHYLTGLYEKLSWSHICGSAQWNKGLFRWWTLKVVLWSARIWVEKMSSITSPHARHVLSYPPTKRHTTVSPPCARPTCTWKPESRLHRTKLRKSKNFHLLCFLLWWFYDGLREDYPGKQSNWGTRMMREGGWNGCIPLHKFRSLTPLKSNICFYLKCLQWV